MDALTTKTVAAFGISIALDMVLFGERDLMKSAYFGAATSSGIYSSGIVVTPILQALPLPSVNSSALDGKTVVQRGAEIATSAALSYGVNRYLLKNDDFGNSEMYFRLGTIALVDVLSTYASDYMTGQPLEFLTGN